jgi:hypothetical protein
LEQTGKACEVVWTRKRIIGEILQIIVLASLGVLMTVAGLTCRDCFDTTREFWIIASFTGFLWVALWKGNSYLADYLSTKVSWIASPFRRLTIGIVATIVYTLVALYFFGAIYYYAFGFNMTSEAWYSVLITMIISLFMHGRAFLINWRQSAVIAEKLKRENIAARYESLKNQVNPHFLFNSLNALTNLVYEDQDKAVKFIKQLSEVYRYVLDTRDKEIVPLASEIEFMNSYMFLQRIRFGNKLRLNVKVSPEGLFIAPLALQMLVENAIKHNVVSEEDPLSIHIFVEDDYILISNNIQERTSSGEISSGIGLENIQKRYEFLTSRKVSIVNDGKNFIVKLPMIREV